MRRSIIREFCGACVAFLTAAGATLGQQPATRPALDALIEQLGDYRYAVRENATLALSEMKPDELPVLVRRYQEEQRHEPKLRLRYAIEKVFYRQFMAGEAGFLGIRLYPMSSVYDPKSSQTVECIVADEVQPGHPASRGGMRDKDILLDFDGHPIARWMNPINMPRPREDAPQLRGYRPEIEAFTASVKRREPGTKIAVRVLRGLQPREVRVPGGQVDPQAFAPTLLPAQGGYYFGLTALTGLVVKRVPENSWMADAGLKPDDVVLSIDNQDIPANATPEVLQRALAAAGSERKVKLVVRPYEQISLTLTLGVRPPEMMNAPDWQVAQSKLAAWWKEEVGEPSVRVRAPIMQFGTASRWVLPPASDSPVVP